MEFNHFWTKFHLFFKFQSYCKFLLYQREWQDLGYFPITNKLFDFKYHPGLENLADYPSKHHSGSHHMEVRPYYVHMPTSPRFLFRADKPSVRRGCVDPGKSLRTPTAIRKYTFPALTRVSPIGGLPRVARPQQSAAA